MNEPDQQQQENTALTRVKEASLDLPDAWDRQSDLVVSFAEELSKRWKIAQYIANSGISPDRKPEAVLTKMLYAYELGLPIMQAMRGMFYLDGNVGLEGSLMDALAVDRCNVRKEVLRKDVRECKIKFKRPGWDDHTASYTMDEAIRAGLVQSVEDDGTVVSRKNNWRNYPVDMLYWRCVSRGLKVVAPDYFSGIYTLEEVEGVAGARSAASGGRSVAAEELEAMESGVELDDIQPLDEEEMEQLRGELQQAVDMGAITEERQSAVLEMAVHGEWADVRTSWDGVRGRMLDVEQPPATTASEVQDDDDDDGNDDEEQESLL